MNKGLFMMKDVREALGLNLREAGARVGVSHQRIAYLDNYTPAHVVRLGRYLRAFRLESDTRKVCDALVASWWREGVSEWSLRELAQMAGTEQALRDFEDYKIPKHLPRMFEYLKALGAGESQTADLFFNMVRPHA